MRHLFDICPLPSRGGSTQHQTADRPRTPDRPRIGGGSKSDPPQSSPPRATSTLDDPDRPRVVCHARRQGLLVCRMLDGGGPPGVCRRHACVRSSLRCSRMQVREDAWGRLLGAAGPRFRRWRTKERFNERWNRSTKMRKTEFRLWSSPVRFESQHRCWAVPQSAFFGCPVELTPQNRAPKVHPEVQQPEVRVDQGRDGLEAHRLLCAGHRPPHHRRHVPCPRRVLHRPRAVLVATCDAPGDVEVKSWSLFSASIYTK